MKLITIKTMLICSILLLDLATARAVMFVSTDDPNYNTTAPAGELANSGWELQGMWGGFLGTPIAPEYFVAARHVGGSIGQSFIYNGVAYTTVAFFDSPNSDLRIWKIAGTFPSYAELYTGSDELGKPLMVFGRGTQSGEEVFAVRYQTNYIFESFALRDLKLRKKDAKLLAAADPLITLTAKTITLPSYTVTTNTVLAGWKWGENDGVKRWGQNQVIASGDFLVAEFNPELGVNVAHLSGGDSSGAVFMQEDGVWKLAGINYGVEGPFSTTANEAPFHAALVDKSGIYRGSYLNPDDGVAKPACFYATRISVNRSWILSIINQ